MSSKVQNGPVTLWRPVGPQELDLIRQSGMRANEALIGEIEVVAEYP